MSRQEIAHAVAVARVWNRKKLAAREDFPGDISGTQPGPAAALFTRQPGQARFGQALQAAVPFRRALIGTQLAYQSIITLQLQWRQRHRHSFQEKSDVSVHAYIHGYDAGQGL
jgi:hypothetical protein